MAFLFRPREPPVEGTLSPSQAETGRHAGLGIDIRSLIDRVKSTMRPAAGDQAADEPEQQGRIARLLRVPLSPVKTKMDVDVKTKVDVDDEDESGAAGDSLNGRDPPPPKLSFKSYRRARRARRGLAA